MSDKQHKEFIVASIDNIRKAHNENYLSVFAGAGISANSNLPKWGDLISELKKLLYGDSAKSEDYLVLAEKFYNQFGENFYYQTLKSLIPDNAKTNDLHLEIVKLNIKNLITTNWDNLFEQAINEEGRFFNIIKSDMDIGNSTGFAKFIKMHGSLDENNIVFKEQDYLEYSKNFPLIENYIKGVFSTDTVILLGYSLNDQNIKQIISWVNSCSKGIKPIYFIKTDEEFDKVEFEFYKNKNIHILYTQEFFGEKGHFEELSDFIKEIKNKSDKTLKIRNGIIDSSRKIRKMIFEFDYETMRRRIDKISLNSSSILDELEKAFLLYHLGQGIQAFETLKINSKQAFRERNYGAWYISLYNMRNMPLFYELDDEKQKKLEKYHKERKQIELNERFNELPFNKREQLKYLRDINTTLKTNLVKAYRLKEKALNDLKIWSSSDRSLSFNDNEINAYRIFTRTLLKYFRFLIIGDQEEFFRPMIEVFFSFIAISQIKEKRRNNSGTILISLKSEHFYCILKYYDNKTLTQKLREYFQETNIVFKVEEKFDLIGVFKNISTQFIQRDMFETEFSKLFKNFLVFTAWMELEQGIFDAIVKICQEKIDAELLWINGYDSVGYFITTQYNKFKMRKNFSILCHILFSFIEKLIKNFRGYSMILKTSICMQNLLYILRQEYIELDPIQTALINTLIEKVMGFSNYEQMWISNLLICDLFPITKNSNDVNQKIRNFLLGVWNRNQNRKTAQNRNQNRKTAQEDEAYLILTQKLHEVDILDLEQYQKIFLELKNKYMNCETTVPQGSNNKPIDVQLFEQAMQEDTSTDRILILLEQCENSFKKV